MIEESRLEAHLLVVIILADIELFVFQVLDHGVVPGISEGRFGQFLTLDFAKLLLELLAAGDGKELIGVVDY